MLQSALPRRAARRAPPTVWMRWTRTRASATPDTPVASARQMSMNALHRPAQSLAPPRVPMDWTRTRASAMSAIPAVFARRMWRSARRARAHWPALPTASMASIRTHASATMDTPDASVRPMSMNARRVRAIWAAPVWTALTRIRVCATRAITGDSVRPTSTVQHLTHSLNRFVGRARSSSRPRSVLSTCPSPCCRVRFEPVRARRQLCRWPQLVHVSVPRGLSGDTLRDER
jgi:hypothetical protein